MLSLIICNVPSKGSFRIQLFESLGNYLYYLLEMVIFAFQFQALSKQNLFSAYVKVIECNSCFFVYFSCACRSIVAMHFSNRCILFNNRCCPTRVMLPYKGQVCYTCKAYTIGELEQYNAQFYCCTVLSISRILR